MTADADPAAIVERLARTARKVRTPCGDGTMVWRVWGKGEPLVLFHGGSGSWTHWIRNVPELSRHFELWVADIPGLGDSTMPPQPWVPATIADVVVAGLGEVLPPSARPRLAGFSFGGDRRHRGARGDRVCASWCCGRARPARRPAQPFARCAPAAPAEIAAVYHQNLAVRCLPIRNIDALAYTCGQRTSARASAAPIAPTDTWPARRRRHRAAGTIWVRAISFRALGPVSTSPRHHPELEVRLIRGAGHWSGLRGGRPVQCSDVELLSA
jgi:pimeloyl-ACP methyl ester carboxylesterase